MLGENSLEPLQKRVANVATFMGRAKAFLLLLLPVLPLNFMVYLCLNYCVQKLLY